MRRQLTLLAVAGAFLASALAGPALPAFADRLEVSHDRGGRDHEHRGSVDRGQELKYRSGHSGASGYYGPAPRPVAYRRGYYGPPPAYYVPRHRRRYQKQDTLPGNVLSGAIGAAIMYGAYRVYNEKKHRNRGFGEGEEANPPAQEQKPAGAEKPADVQRIEVEPVGEPEGNAELP